MPAEHDDAKWEAYSETMLEFDAAPPVRVDLQRPLTHDTRQALAALGLGTGFAVLTAENPGGENVEDAPTAREAERREGRNERRTSRLETELARAGVPFVRVDGVAPDGDYREHCVAAVMAQRGAIDLAHRLAQLALFWYDGQDFWLLPAQADGDPTRLPRQ